MLAAAKWCTRRACNAPRMLRGGGANAVRSFSATAAPKKSSSVIKYTLGGAAILIGASSAHIYSDEGYRRAAYVTYEACRLSAVYGCKLLALSEHALPRNP